MRKARRRREAGFQLAPATAGYDGLSVGLAIRRLTPTFGACLRAFELCLSNQREADRAAMAMMASAILMPCINVVPANLAIPRASGHPIRHFFDRL